MYEIGLTGKLIAARLVSGFSCVASGVGLHQENVLCLEADKISIRTYQVHRCILHLGIFRTVAVTIPEEQFYVCLRKRGILRGLEEGGSQHP